jgi:hypothetical protein
LVRVAPLLRLRAYFPLEGRPQVCFVIEGRVLVLLKGAQVTVGA